MKKQLLLLALIVCSFGMIKAQSIYKNDAYKFQMIQPPGLEIKTKVVDGFGMLGAYEEKSKTSIFACGYVGEVTKANIYAFGVKVTNIPAKYWTKTKEGKDANGFAWWEMFKVSANGETLYAICAKNAKSDISYLFFVHAPDASFKSKTEAYLTWLNSCKGLE